ncbi:MAG: DNA mismatch repair endonuclease MutL [Pseudomonadota bacterium]
MPTIKQLPIDVIEKIAAGEVVERPASVVKELIENAIDAKAKAITIDVAGGGSKRITVIDDGFGMDVADLKNSVLRHATSKIISADDLWRITTMGFRGEALASIAAVSRLTIESKLNDAQVIEGACIEVAGGEIYGPRVAGCAGGTRVEVRDLFFNVPARRKFLRSASVEAGHIYDTVVALAMAYPHIRFELTVDNSRKLSLLPAQDMERAKAIFGERARNGLINVEEVGPEISIRGLIACGGRKGGKDTYFFLNQRPIKDRMLMHALTQAFGERSTGNAYPAAALWIDVDPTKVDVNVHPTKREVRFADGGAVHSFVSSAIKKPMSTAEVKVATSGPSVEDAIMRFERNRLNDVGDAKGRAYLAPRIYDSPIESTANLRPLGQYGLSYIVCEHADGSLVLIDQHAAHERLGFEKLRANFKSGCIPRQRLLIPENVELGEKSAAYVVEHIEILTKAGFEIEPFGGGTVLVKAVPDHLGGASVAPLMQKLATEFEELGRSASIAETMDRIFAVVACHRQVRAGDRLELQEMAQLVRDIERENITSCPHGRPAAVRIDKGEVEKWFKRK